MPGRVMCVSAAAVLLRRGGAGGLGSQWQGSGGGEGDRGDGGAGSGGGQEAGGALVMLQVGLYIEAGCLVEVSTLRRPKLQVGTFCGHFEKLTVLVSRGPS